MRNRPRHYGLYITETIGVLLSFLIRVFSSQKHKNTACVRKGNLAIIIETLCFGARF